MKFFLIAAAVASFLGSSFKDQGVIPTITSVGDGPVLANAASTNVSWPNTNVGVVYSVTTLTGATTGDQYSFTAASNYTFIGFDNFTPDVAEFTGGRTIYKTNGVFRYRYSLRNTNGFDVACAGSLSIGTTTGGATINTFSNFVSGTLANDLYTNIVAITNAGRDGILWDSIAANGWKWHTNSVIFGKHGYTALSQMTSLQGNNGFPWKFTAITKRHAYSAGHVFGGNSTNGYVYFVGSDGATNSMFVTDCRSRNLNALTQDDYCIVFFNADLPSTVQPIKVCVSTNFFAKMPTGKTSINFPEAWFETCQHGRFGSQGMLIFDNHGMHVGGDSGNPDFFIHGTNLVNFQGTSGTLLSTTNFINDMNAMTISAGLNTNDYQPTYFDLSDYPVYYP